MNDAIQKIVTDATLGAKALALEKMPEAERLSAEFHKARSELDRALLLVEFSKQTIDTLLMRHNNNIMSIVTEKAEALKAAHAACVKFTEHIDP